jgi:hypothetical protein
MSDAQLKLHTLGTKYPVKWVTIHTSVEGDTAAFDANAAAKAAGATPFKRPENMAWLPGSNFRTFFFDPGDTNAVAGNDPSLAARGAFGAIFRVDLNPDDFPPSPSKPDGRISIFVLGDHEHNSFDNLAFADKNTLLAAEDRGETLHTQLNTLDSVWAFSLNTSKPVPFGPAALHAANPKAIRFIALGLDATAAASGEDNEPTGLFVSNGSVSKDSLLGTEGNLEGALGFLTRQHGDNKLFRIFHKHAPR